MEKDREKTSAIVDQEKETNRTETEPNTTEIPKAINRRRQSKIFDSTFGDYVETYGRKEDAQIASWNYLKEMKEVTKNIVSNVGTIGREMV
ncbi:MAG: hypothetical protein K2I72_02345, partial [Bacilli bacterium]|nr:hypothetical protein [Bacilli bacterium]